MRLLAAFTYVFGTLSGLLCGVARSQQPKVILDDRKALVTSIELSPDLTFSLPSGQPGSVWIALDSMTFSKRSNGLQGTRQVRAGYAKFIRPKEQVAASKSGSRAHLIVVIPKKPTRALTLSSFLMTDGEEDASDRGATLLIAVSDCRFRDVRDVGDENEAIWSKPETITMKSGDIRWIRPGIHSFKNLGQRAANLVSIEF